MPATSLIDVVTCCEAVAISCAIAVTLWIDAPVSWIDAAVSVTEAARLVALAVTCSIERPAR